MLEGILGVGRIDENNVVCSFEAADHPFHAPAVHSRSHRDAIPSCLRLYGPAESVVSLYELSKRSSAAERFETQRARSCVQIEHAPASNSVRPKHGEEGAAH